MREWFLPRGEVWQKKRYSRFSDPSDQVVPVPLPGSNREVEVRLASVQLLIDLAEENRHIVFRDDAVDPSQRFYIKRHDDKHFVDQYFVDELLDHRLLVKKGSQFSPTDTGRQLARWAQKNKSGKS